MDEKILEKKLNKFNGKHVSVKLIDGRVWHGTLRYDAKYRDISLNMKTVSENQIKDISLKNV